MVHYEDFVPYQEEYDYSPEDLVIGLEWNPFMDNQKKLKILPSTFDEMCGGTALIQKNCLFCSKTKQLQLTNQTCTLHESTKDYKDNNPNPKKELANTFDFMELDSDEEEDTHFKTLQNYETQIQRKQLTVTRQSDVDKIKDRYSMEEPMPPNYKPNKNSIPEILEEELDELLNTLNQQK